MTDIFIIAAVTLTALYAVYAIGAARAAKRKRLEALSPAEIEAAFREEHGYGWQARH